MARKRRRKRYGRKRRKRRGRRKRKSLGSGRKVNIIEINNLFTKKYI